ncbi:response regulator [Bacteroides sp. OttesenSCG-928-M17]|nr:response regulator [Bacteroides sp. OttesenSCG-928-M17]
MWFFSCVGYLVAQEPNITFNHLTTDDGLSQFSVNSLYIDEKGSVWIGTREGLNRYNGNDIKTYKLQKNDPHSLFCNTVLRITGNKNGQIYLLCTEGVAAFDLAHQKFTTLIQGNINSIYYNERLYIGIRNEIYVYNEETRNFDLYYQLAGKDIVITCLSIDSDNSMWIGTHNGTYKLKEKKELSRPVLKGDIISIYEDSAGELWMGTWEHGLFRVDRKGNVTNYRHQPGNPEGISSDFARWCCEDNMGNIWIGTFNGLNLYRKESGTFHNYTAKKEEAESLTHSSVWCIVKDDQGTLWLGTYFGGVNYFNPEYEIYNYYSESAIESEGLSSPIVGRMLEDKKGNLWICTEGGGVNVYEREKKRFKWYKAGTGANALSGQNVKAIYYDEDEEKMWIGTHLGGLNKLDIKTNRFTHYRMKEGDSTTLPSDIIRDIVPYKEMLVIATQNGVCLFNPQTEKCSQLFTDKSEGQLIQMVADLQFDRKGVLWMAVTGEGVFSYDFKSDKLVNYRNSQELPNSLSNNNVNSISEDSSGNLWFSTSGSGLDLYRRETNDFENFDSYKNGLSSDCIYEVLESGNKGQLLMITNQGFSVFDYIKKTVRNYGKESGFPLTATNENALYVTQDGEVFIGGVKGMISFYEKELNFTSKPYNINLTRLIVNGEEIQPADESGILEKAICYTNDITLKANQSMFIVEFTTSNYIPANKKEILYRLEGFSQDWNHTRGQRSITYTNLNPGNYKLVIRSDDDNSLIEQRVLNITILPPFYKTVWAYLLYTLVIGALLWYLIVTYNSHIRLRESLKYEQKHLKDIEALNHSKLRFFTNISHEFRTPLTLIVGQVEALLQLQSFTPVIYNKVLGIYKNSLQLKELITELLDFRKQEQGHMKIKAASHNLVEFLYENYLLFLEYASNKQITLNFNKEVDALEVWYDFRQMQKVINNLLSNALKHTPEYGTITMGVRQENNHAIIEITDTGSGIKQEEIDKIFDRFYQTEQIESLPTDTGTGIGLALTKGIVELHHGTIRVASEHGKGTTFTVTMQLGNQHFTPDQIGKPVDEVQQIELKSKDVEEIPDMEWEEAVVGKRIPDAKILVVEDNESIKNMLAEIFATFYQVVTASDGEEALEKVQTEMPNIVLSDVVMPRMSGTELCKKIKTNPDTCHIPVVLLTARTAIKHTIEGLRIGADDYITKPFNINILISRCNNLVNSRLLLQERFSKQPQAFAQVLATNPIDKEILDKAIEIIESHLDDTNFNINVFAREMAMARTNLFAKIKAITGQTPNDFILTIRLKKGAVMLRSNPELNVSEIADKIGFSSSRYFSKCFKDAYHINPLAYRKGEDADKEGEEEEES